MAVDFKSELWVDGTWWETKAPAGWTIDRDTTIKGWPYVFRSPDGGTLIVWTAFSKITWVSRPSWVPPLPDNLESEAEKNAYELTEHNARSAGSFHLVRRTLGCLVGFTYEIGAPPDTGWEGFFISEAYMVHARFESPLSIYERVAPCALAILASIEFRT